MYRILKILSFTIVTIGIITAFIIALFPVSFKSALISLTLISIFGGMFFSLIINILELNQVFEVEEKCDAELINALFNMARRDLQWKTH